MKPRDCETEDMLAGVVILVLRAAGLIDQVPNFEG